MSVCTPCYDSGITVGNCSLGLTFGTAEAETDYVVSVQHNATKRIQTFAITSDDSGNLTIEGVGIDSLQGYTLWISEDGERVPLTVGGEAYPCISFSVSKTDEEPAIVNLTI
jgi:hypothetical protein